MVKPIKLQEVFLTEIATLTPLQPFEETVTPSGTDHPLHQAAQASMPHIAKLEQCAVQVAHDVVGDGAQVTLNKENPQYHFQLEAKGADTAHLEGGNLSNLLAKTKSLLGQNNSNAFQFNLAKTPDQHIDMKVTDARGDPTNAETFRQTAAYVSLKGEDVQRPGTIQTGKIGEVDLGQLSATDSVGVSAVKKLRDCMR